MNKFNVGDRVKARGVNSSDNDSDDTVVIGVKYFPDGLTLPDGLTRSAPCWGYKTLESIEGTSFREESLTLIDDGREIGSWENCVWKPKEILIEGEKI